MKQKLLLLLLLIIAPVFAQNKNQTIGFKENKGQIIDQKGKLNSDVKFLLKTKGLNVQIKNNGFSYDIYETKKHPLSDKQKAKLNRSSLSENNKEILLDYSLEYVYHRIDIDFVNSNPKVELIKEEESKDYDNYYNIPNKPDGILMVHQYKQITYKNIYPNIDVVFSIPKDSLKAVEYNFVVHPKGKISDIQLKFGGAETELANNKIKMQIRFGEMEEILPTSWIENGKDKKETAVGYKKISKDIYGFESAENISNKTLIIDPVPIRLWGTYYGGEGEEFPSDITTNSNNEVFISGVTWSTTNIATSGTHLSNLNGTTNLFFAKLDTDGNRIWATYFYTDKGFWNSHPAIIKTDSTNNLYFAAAEQYSTNIATPGAFQTVKNDYIDVILVKLNNLGIREWATYYGGNGNEYAHSICIDNSDNVYIAGETNSSDVMASPNAHQANNGATDNNNDGFIAKFDAAGNRLWGTFYGGLGTEGFQNISISDDGYLYATGIQSSRTNIATPNAYQENYYGTNYYGNSFINNIGGMIVKFNLDGNRLWGTYICDDSLIYRAKLQGDNLYLMGKTQNKTTIATPNTLFGNFQTIDTSWNGANLNANENSCIVSFNVKTQTKNWGTYFIEEMSSIDVNKEGETYFSGGTTLYNGIATTDGYLPTNTSLYKVYFIKLNNLGQRVWGTYYGGEGGEQLPLIHLDSQQNIYLYGVTFGSTTGIATPGAYQTTIRSNSDNFLVKFKDCLSSIIATSNSPICIGKTLELKASGGTNYAWTGPNSFTSTDQNPTILNVTSINSGQYSCAITGTGDCDDTKTINVIVGDTVAPIPNLATLPIITSDCNTIITTIPTATDTCAGTIIATTTSPLSYSIPGTYTIFWKYDDGNGNSVNQNQTVSINSQPLPTTTSPQNFCIQQNANLSSITITGQNIKWYDASTNGNLLSDTTPLQNEKTYYASQTINGCESDRVSVRITIQNTNAPTGNANQTFCSSQNPTLDTIIVSGTAIQWYNSTEALLSNSTPLINGQTYYATQTLNGCESPTKLSVTVLLISTLPANNYTELFCDDLNDGSEKINLSDYNSKLISNTSGYTFDYYSVFSGAENQLVANQITNFSNYDIALGDNKIYVRINSNTSCYAIAELKLTLLSKPKIMIPDVLPICENNTISIDAGSGFDTYLWSNGATTQSIIVANPGDFSVTVTDDYAAFYCSSTKNFTVKKSNIATITSIDTQDWTDNQNNITTYVTGNGDFEYSIDGIHFQNSNQFSNITNGQYTVSVRDKNGCGTVTDEVYLLMYPKFFTPNGDGYNDTWKIKFSDFEDSLTIKIFDRYGKFITELIQNASWNGTLNGTELPSSDYWFIVTRANGKEYRGHFSLNR